MELTQKCGMKKHTSTYKYFDQFSLRRFDIKRGGLSINQQSILSDLILLDPFHYGVIKWEHFLCHWSFVRGIHQSPLIPLTMASDVELWCFLWSALERKAEQTIEMLMIWDAIALIMTSIWCVATKIWHPHILGFIHMIPKYSKYSKWQSYNILICIGSLSVIAEAKYDLSSVRSSDIHLSAILQEISQPSVTEISWKLLISFFFKPPRGQWVNYIPEKTLRCNYSSLP